MPDFNAMRTPIRFTGAAPADDVPRPLLRKQSATRRLAQLREARQILDVLPAPGESLHALQSGNFDTADIVEVLLDKLGPVEHLRIATLSFNRNNLAAIRTWLSAGKVGLLSLLCSRFFVAHNGNLFAEALEAITAPHRLASSQTHCKVMALAFVDPAAPRLVLEGSANLRSCNSREQLALIADADLHDWHAAWIDEEVQRHEGK